MTKHVYEAIAAITEEMSKEGISKTRKNQQQGYSFRGIDEVLNALSPLLAKHKLNILPRCVERDCVERTTAKGGVIFYVTVKSEFDFVSAVDASLHTVTTYGEAMDSADKATNKAMSAAYKYAAFQAFCIPTEGDNDADAHTHEIAPREPVKPKPPEYAIKMNEGRKKLLDLVEKGDKDGFASTWFDYTEWFEQYRQASPANQKYYDENLLPLFNKMNGEKNVITE